MWVGSPSIRWPLILYQFVGKVNWFVNGSVVVVGKGKILEKILDLKARVAQLLVILLKLFTEVIISA